MLRSTVTVKMLSYLVIGTLISAGYVRSVDIDMPIIIHGKNATVEEYPFIVQVEFYERILHSWTPNCAASILTSSWVISAAHCFEGNNFSPKNRRIRAGTTFLGVGGDIHNVETVHIHPNYGKAAEFDADIACAKLVTPLQFGDVIKAVEMNKNKFSNQLKPDSLVQYIGWGDLSVGGNGSYVLQQVTVNIVNNTKCAERYKKQYGKDVVTENMICAGNWVHGGIDACQGDSGGPLYYNGLLFGIISWGYYCARPEFPGVSTNIAAYAQWINETTTI